jgi:hypothetical protein
VSYLRRLLHGNLYFNKIRSSGPPYIQTAQPESQWLQWLAANRGIIYLTVEKLTALLMMYVLVKLVKKQYHFITHNEKDYIEIKEFLSKATVNQSILRRLLDSLKSKSDAETIRRYYLNFMKLCLKKKIELKPCDTTLDIAEKARQIFDHSILDALQEIYVGIRYGGKNGDEPAAKLMKQCYQKLKDGN